MSFEVDAFMGAPAAPPPTRAEAPRAAPEGPSFDDHLDEAAAEPETVETRPAENKPESKAKETPEQPEQPTAAPVPPAPPQPQAPIVIQLIAEAPPTSDAPVEADAAAAETPETAPQAPSAPPPVAPVKASAAKSDATDAETQDAPIEAAQPKGDAPAKSHAALKAEAPQPEAPAADVAPEATQQALAQAPQQAPMQQRPDAPPQQAPQPHVIAQAAPAPRVANDAARVEDTPDTPMLEAPEAPRAAKADIDPRTEAPKASAPPPNAKDNFAALGALAAQDSGQQTQASAQTTPVSAVGGADLTPQSGRVNAEDVARAAPAAAQVSREIVRRFNGQTTSFEMRLDPPELGKVEVRLEVSRDHKVTAVVAAESPAALAELARNARELQQALQSAGLDLSDKGLSFDLKQQRENRADGEDGSSRAHANGDDNAQTASAPAPSRPIGLESWRGVRVDLVA